MGTGAGIVAAPFFVASTILALGGVAKVREPEHLSQVLRVTELPSRLAFVRIVGCFELAAGVAALIRPDVWTGTAVSALYALFALFLVWVIARKVPVSSCGCLGARETPPSLIHVVLNLGAVAAAVTVASGIRPAGLVSFLAHLSYLGVPFVIGASAIGYLAYLSVALLPTALSSYTRTANTADGGG